MAFSISASYNSSTDSPGIDLLITDALGYERILVERIDNTGTYPITPVRGLNNAPVGMNVIDATDFEAPIGISVKYRAVVSDFDPEITLEEPGTDASGVTSANVPAPTGSNAGDMNILEVVMKPYTATMATPTGWTLLTSRTSGVSASGPDSGSVVVYAFYREGQLTSDTAVAGTGSNVVQAAITRFQKGVSNAWAVSAVSATDEIAGSGHNATSASSFTPQYGDVIFSITGTNTDNLLDISGSSLSLANASVSSTAQAVNVSTSTGDDVGLYGVFSRVVSSSGSGAPSVAISATSALFGATIFVRLSVTGATSTSAESGSITIPYASTGQAWIKSVFSPALSRQVHVREWPETTFEPQILGEFNVLGRAFPVIITDAWGHRTGQFKLITGRDDLGTFKEIKELLITGGTLLFQTTGNLAEELPDMYLEIKGYTATRLETWGSHSSVLYEHAVTFIEVDQPTTDDAGLGLRSYQDIVDNYTTYQNVLDQNATYLDLLNG